MGTKPNYFKIGLFVLMGMVILVLGITLFSAELLGQERLYFETYFDNSVHGLSQGSPVEARGVQIGRVERICFVGDEYDITSATDTSSKYQRYVMVVVSVDPDFMRGARDFRVDGRLQTLVDGGMRIRYATEILTGLGYLEAEFLDPGRFPLLEIEWEPRHTYLPSAPGEFSTLKDSVDKILYKLEKIDLEQIGQTTQDLLNTLHQAIIAADLPGVSTQLQQVLAQVQAKIAVVDTAQLSEEAQTWLKEANKALVELNVLLARPQTYHLPANLPLMIDQLYITLKRIDRLMITQGPQIDRILEDAKSISENLGQFSETLSRNPSTILFSDPPKETEP